MRSRANFSMAAMIAMSASMVGGVGPCLPRTDREPESLLAVTALTEEEKKFLESRDRSNRECWLLRFKRGLTQEQRRYIDACLEEMKHG